MFLFLRPDNSERDYQGLPDQDVRIVRPHVIDSYGTVAAFADLYSHLWDLIEPVPAVT